jgi:hypothetical protein
MTVLGSAVESRYGIEQMHLTDADHGPASKDDGCLVWQQLAQAEQPAHPPGACLQYMNDYEWTGEASGVAYWL